MKDNTSIHKEVLTSTQREFFNELGFTKTKGFYLAGGTALALQLNHRRSVDFDFYTQGHFKRGELISFFKENLPDWEIKVVRDTDNTFEISASPDIHLSCFYYKYPLIGDFEKINSVRVAALPDIAAMKIVAISQRGLRRDFVDIYYLLQKYSLKEILHFTEEKFPEFDIYHGLRGLVYFKDAEGEEEDGRLVIFDENFSWQEAKEYIMEAVQGFQKSSIK